MGLNKIMEKMQSIRKKVLIVVPHQDDEINIAGTLIPQLLQAGHDVNVIFVTNGDFDCTMPEGMRLLEAERALGALNIDASKIIFLGYGDQWSSSHIYHYPGEDRGISSSGRKETYGIAGHEDYRFQKSGHHSLYTRNNLKCDLKEALLEIAPDILICVDFDDHPDHRAVSLIFEEVIGEILHEEKSYQPIILKSFAYSGVWFGKSDYWRFKPTLKGRAKLFGALGYELDNPTYIWDNRIAVKTPLSLLTPHLRDNPLYAVSLNYRSQPLSVRLQKVINTDSLYWCRRTDSELYKCQIDASSGNTIFVNDFKILDCRDVSSNKLDNFYDFGWIPEESDATKTITFKFKNPVSISQISLYETISAESHILDCLISFDNGVKYHTGELKNRAAENIRVLDEKQCNILSFSIKIVKWKGTHPGFAEIEAFENYKSLEMIKEELPFKYGSQTIPPYYKRYLFENLYYDFLFLIKFKLRYGIQKLKRISCKLLKRQ